MICNSVVDMNSQVEVSNNMQEKLRSGLLLGLGNPLLDISVTVDKAFLDKYDLKENDAILANEKHKNLYSDLMALNPDFLAGGSVQNTLRVAQWILETPNVATFFGCVGNDKYADILKDIAIKAGVNVKYQYENNKETGTCAVLITNNHRSLCANLAAAECFTIDHLHEPENRKLLESAQFYYISGFFLTVSPTSIQEVAKYALAHDRPFLMNLSAPFLSQFFKKPMMDAMPYVDVLFGNETEAETFAKEQSFGTNNLKEIALKICNLPKLNEKRKRVVVLTQGHLPVILAHNEKIVEIPVDILPKEKIVDTNGAGDAFAGGFLAQYIQGRYLETCVKCGIWTASQIIQRPGCTYEGKATFKI